MSEFSDLWTNTAAPLLTEQFADAPLCTPIGLVQRAVTAIVWPEEVVEEQTQHDLKRTHTRRLSVPRTSDAANGGSYLASPGIGDQWTIDSVAYRVDAIESQTEDETVLRLVRLAVHEKARDGLRRRN